MSEWISVKDRLPESIGDYLAWIQKPEIGLRYRDVLTYAGDQGFFEQDPFVTHWQPLPQPPCSCGELHEEIPEPPRAE